MVRFYKCAHCGSIVVKINDLGPVPSCCGEPMQEMRVGTTDGALEKHVPVVLEQGNKVLVKVGDVAHPMVEDHWIQWIYLLTDKGGTFHFLKPGDVPATTFVLDDDEVVLAVYEYCNKHGLYKANLD